MTIEEYASKFDVGDTFVFNGVKYVKVAEDKYAELLLETTLH